MIIANGSTDVTTYWVLRDSTTHLPKTSVTITDIDVYYVEAGAAISAKADLTALAAADSAHADNKGFEIGQGMYRIDWPDAAFDGGVGKVVTLIVVCSGVDTTYLEVELSPPVNTVALGGTAQTGRDIGASVLLSSGTGTGQVSLASGAVTAGAIATGAVDADALAADAATEIADAILARDLGSGSNAVVNEERTVRSALRFLRNKWSVSGTTLTVTVEDDSTPAWTSALTSSASADPVTGSDPT